MGSCSFQEKFFLCFSLFQNEAALLECSGQPAAEEAPQQDEPESCPVPPDSFLDWLAEGCPEVQSPGPEDAGQDELDHYSEYYQTHYSSAADGSSYQQTQEKGPVSFFFCSSCPFVSLQDWPETQTWHYTSWSDYKQDYGNWPTDQASDSNDWDSQDKGNWSSDHQPWTQYQQEDICSWSTDHDQHSYGNWTYQTDQAHESMPADPHHDDGTSNKDVDGEHADCYHADEKVR